MTTATMWRRPLAGRWLGSALAAAIGLSGLTGLAGPAAASGSGRIGANRMVVTAAPGASAARTQRLFNADPANPLTISALSIVGQHAGDYVLDSAPGLPVTVPPNSFVSLGISFHPGAAESGSLPATLAVSSSDPGNNGNYAVPLRGLAAGPAAAPSLQALVDTLQIPVTTGSKDITTPTLPARPVDGEELRMPSFLKAGSGPVTVTPLASFTLDASPVAAVGFRPTGAASSTALLTIGSGNGATLYPPFTGATSFDPGAAAFSLTTSFGGSGHQISQDDHLNSGLSQAHQVRVYPARAANGAALAATYLVAFDDGNGNDNTDAVLQVANVAPAVAAPQAVIGNGDGAPAPDRFVTNRIGPVNSTAYTTHNVTTLLVRNVGSAPLTVSGVAASTSDVAIGQTFPQTVAAQGVLSVPLRSLDASIPVEQTDITVTTNDPVTPTLTATLIQLWTSCAGGGCEPTFQTQMQAFGFSDTTAPGPTYENSVGRAALIGDEIAAPYFLQNDPARPVTVRQFGAFHGQGNSESFEYYSQGATSTPHFIFTHDATTWNSVFPPPSNLANPITGSFNTTAPWGVLVVNEYSDDSLNYMAADQARGCTGACGHHVRTYPVKIDGVTIPHQFIVTMDLNGPCNCANYDFQDNVYLVSNASVVGQAPVQPAGPTPAITAVSPQSTPAVLPSGSARTITETVTGSGFGADAVVAVSGTGITVGAATVAPDGTSLSVPLTLAPGVAPGSRALTVTNGNGHADTLGAAAPGAFTLTAPVAPTITRVSPGALAQGATRTVTVTGTGFHPGAQPSVSGSGVSVGSVAVAADGTSLTVVLTADPAAALGARDLTVTNPDDATTTTAAGALGVDAPPTLSALSPATRAAGSAPATLTLTGTGFSPGATVGFTDPRVTVGAVTVTSPTTITATVSVGAADSPGTTSDVQVANTDGGSATLGAAFTVSAPPTVTSVTPASGQAAAAAVTVEIDGTGFEVDAAPAVSGTGVTVSSVTVDSPTRITAQVSSAGSATPGARDVSVTNGDGGVGVLSGGFTVTPPPAPPTITGVTPSALGQGASRTLTITGTHFHPDTVVTISGTGVTVTSTAVSPDGTRVTVAASADPAAPIGARDVSVANASDGTAATAAGAVTVDASPSVSSLAPAARAAGSPTATVTITGTGFATGATVSLSDPSVTVGPTTVISATTLSVDITVVAGHAPGPLDVTVTNLDQGATTRAAAFTVDAPPTVTAITPSTREAGSAPVSVQIDGTGFTPGAQPTVTGGGVNLTGVTVVSPTRLSAQLSVDRQAAAGPHDLTVTTRDGGTATLSGALTVTPAPTVTGVTYRDPAATSGGAPTARQGVSPTVVLTGSGFDAQAVVVLDSGSAPAGDTRARISVTSTVVVSPTEIDVTLSLGTIAPVGGHTFTVTDPGGVSAVAPWTVTASSQARRFVAQVYRDMLGRDVDGAGWDYWSGRIDAGDGSVRDAASRSELVRQIEGSEEFLGTVVVDRVLFGAPAGGGAPARGLLKRLPDPAGHSYYLAQLRNGVTLQQERALVLGSAEYYMGAANGGGSVAQWVSAVYADVLGRAPSAGETSYWQGRAAAVGRTQAAYEVVQSDEGVTRVVSADYAQFLRRTTTTDDPQGRAYWRGQLQAGLPEQQFIAVLLGSQEYADALR